MKNIKYLVFTIMPLMVTGCSLSDIDMSELDKIIILSCLGIIIISTLIIVIISLTKLSDKKKIKFDDNVESTDNDNLNEESNK